MADGLRQPKELPDWMELDYYNRQRPLRHWRRRLTIGVFLALGVLALASVLASITTGHTARLYQARPLAEPHAKFNGDCQLCHTTPFRTALRLNPAHANVHAVADQACNKCHNPSDEKAAEQLGPRAATHNKVLGTEPNCAECHREHRGREAQLKRVHDDHCLACHADLKTHRFRAVTGFPNGHPEFALHGGTSDPGQIKFNHKLHLELPDQLVTAKGRPLTCADCHEPEGTGRYMRPINHEQHCAVCHGGQRKVVLAGRFLDDSMQQAADQFSVKPVPHEPPGAIRDNLRGRLLAFLALNPLDKGSGDDLLQAWPRDKGELVWKPLTVPMASYHRERFLPPQLEQMESQLFERSSGCIFCHNPKPDSVRDMARTPDGLPTYQPPQQPSRWLRQGEFNHAKHRMMDCVQCHEAPKSSKTADVLMPKVAQCADCHRPGGSARFDCAECHKYHGREPERAAAHSFTFPPSRWK